MALYPPTPRTIKGEPAPLFLAHRHSHRWGGAMEDSTSDHEYIIDADTDLDRLRDRVNAYFARPDVIDMERRNKLVIPPGETVSNTVYGSGGGCNYYACIKITDAPILRTYAEEQAHKALHAK